jgi:hypothetical protein
MKHFYFFHVIKYEVDLKSSVKNIHFGNVHNMICKSVLAGSDDIFVHLILLGLWPSSIIWYSKQNRIFQKLSLFLSSG